MPKGTTRRQHADHVTRTLASILRDKTITEPVALVAGLIILMSTTLIYAREKIGKTTFLMYLIKRLALGLPIFGRTSPPQTVLLASLEEGMHLIKMRAKEMGIPQTAPIHILRSVIHATKSPIQVLEDAIVETGATVVVLDTLSAYSVGQIQGESQSGWNDLLYPLTQLTSKHNFSLVIVHHANKGGHDFRGSTVIGAAVDTVASLSIPKGAPANVRRIRHTGRYGSADMYVARSSESGDYELVEGDSVPTDVVRGASTDDQLIERILKARCIEGGATKRMLRTAGAVQGSRTDGAVNKLLTEGRLVKQQVRGGFRYATA